MDTLSILGIILSISSITLAIVAIWFAWVSYKNSTDMQMKAQSILEQISQKVEVIVDKTSHQIDRAWDYFTQSTDSNQKEKEPSSFNPDELKKQLIDETKKESEKMIKDLGIDKDKILTLENKISEIVNKTTVKAEEVFNKQLLIDKYSQVEMTIKNWYRKVNNWEFPQNITLINMLENKEIRKIFPYKLNEDLQKLIEARNKIAHSEEVSIFEIENSISIANNILEFFKKN